VEGIRFFTADNRTPTSSRIGQSERFYESYNAAALLDTSAQVQFYNKSKLVPGVETLPSFLKFLADLFEKFGGTTGGYTPQGERTVLVDKNSGFRIAPAICYESIYGEFLTGYIRNGANILVIVTNDGWWANTSGHKQHMHYARLRAIEMRRWIARSANTGISCFISPEGKVFQPRPWDTEAAISMAIPARTEITFFARYGDVLSKMAAGVTLIIIFWMIFLFFKSKLMKTSTDA
jgi:apolipoprotein N-acyltransferase